VDSLIKDVTEIKKEGKIIANNSSLPKAARAWWQKGSKYKNSGKSTAVSRCLIL